MIKYLIEDLKLALNENIYTHEINKNKVEEIKENIEADDKSKNNIDDNTKNISIKLNFLGLILRYKSLRNKFYETIKEVDPSLNCFLHFRNVLALTVDLVLESNKDFEDYQRDNLFYLTK